ncbi:MAG: TolC family protein [Deltaproteobacteria bacterium]|nr:TolC family protein [Deltaproteobacteria bacterium]
MKAMVLKLQSFLVVVPVMALAVIVFSGGAAAAKKRTLTLEEALNTAFDNHPNVQASEYALEAARANVNVTRGGFLPSLDFVAGYSRGTGNLVPTPGAAGFGTAANTAAGTTTLIRSTRTYNFFDFGLVLVQPIWDFGRTLGAYDASKAASKAAQSDLRTTRLDTWFAVVTAYYGVLAAQEMYGVAQRTRDQTRIFANRAKEMYEVGARPRIDVVRTETDAQAAEAAFVSARENLKLASSALLATMGAANRFEFDVVRPKGPALTRKPPPWMTRSPRHWTAVPKGPP